MTTLPPPRYPYPNTDPLRPATGKTLMGVYSFMQSVMERERIANLDFNDDPGTLGQPGQWRVPSPVNAVVTKALNASPEPPASLPRMTITDTGGNRS